VFMPSRSTYLYTSLKYGYTPKIIQNEFHFVFQCNIQIIEHVVVCIVFHDSILFHMHETPLFFPVFFDVIILPVIGRMTV